MNFSSKIPILRSFVRAYALTKFKKEWRKRNKQNQTVPMNIFPMECVEVGNGTYGELHILSYFPPIEKLTIGNYVALASNVHFILSGSIDLSTVFLKKIKNIFKAALKNIFSLSGHRLWRQFENSDINVTECSRKKDSSCDE